MCTEARGSHCRWLFFGEEKARPRQEEYDMIIGIHLKSDFQGFFLDPSPLSSQRPVTPSVCGRISNHEQWHCQDDLALELVLRIPAFTLIRGRHRVVRYDASAIGLECGGCYDGLSGDPPCQDPAKGSALAASVSRCTIGVKQVID